MLTSLKLLQPSTVAEASQALAEHGDNARIYAGGAELLLLMRHGLVAAEVLIDIKKIDRLHRIQLQDGALRVGACVTHHALENNPLVREHAPTLASAESQLANVRVRSQGTLGGNLAFNDPHSDPGTALLVHDAAVILGDACTERRVPLSEFFLDMYATALQPSELLVEIEIPRLPAEMKSAYRRLHRYQRPTLGVAAAARASGGTIEEARLAVGCVGPQAQRLTDLEGKIKGAKLDDARRIVGKEKMRLGELLRPVDDLMGSAEYKLYMTGVMLCEALEAATGGVA
ncbi:MAG TPA: xanthine dehydrogenase family protein subunit M [Candidatus Binatia bacterium]|jgi:carbon-monoxide dehydrogenase medium subunit